MKWFLLAHVVFLVLSCSYDTGPEKAAKEFCNCLDKYKSITQPNVAFEICEAKIHTKFSELQYYYYNCRHEGSYPIDINLKNQAFEFEEKYFDYKVLHCCELVGKCLLKHDSFYLSRHPILGSD